MFCKKCESLASVTLRRKDTYCEACFTASTNHKFRSCLGKNRVLSHDDTVLLALSGGKGSMVLFNLVHNGIELNTHKKLRIKAICLYLYGLNPDQDKDMKIAENLIQVCNSYNLDLYIVHVSQYFEKDLDMPAVNSVSEVQNKSNELYKSKEAELNPTEFTDYKTKIMRNLFIRMGKTLKCKKIFTAETTTKLASNLLSNIVLGRGSQIEYDVGFLDNRDEHIKIIRPMKDISLEELLYYIKIKNISYLEQEDYSDSSSMQSLITSFVVDLQENFPATISTVCKTADKIGTHDDMKRENLCNLCQSDISKNHKLKLTALEATNFSKAVCYGLVKDEKAFTTNINNFVLKNHCYGCSRSIKLN